LFPFSFVIISATLACSLIAPTDEDLFDNNNAGAGGTGGVGGTRSIGGRTSTSGTAGMTAR
jgi:hypothetical protein